MNPFHEFDANFDQNRLNAYMQSRQAPVAAPVAPIPQKKKKSFLVDNISTVGGILGGIGGGIAGGAAGFGIGAVPGAAVGGAAGSALGETLENYLTGDSLGKNVAKEAVLGGVFSAGPIKLAKLGLGIPAALAARGSGEVVGGAAKALTGAGVKSFAEGAGKNIAADAAEQAGGKVLKTSFQGKLVSAGNEALKSQYGTISKPIARATNPGQTIGKLADMGIIKPMDAERTAQSITGSDGILTQAVSRAIGGAGKVTLKDTGNVLKKSITDNNLEGLQKGTALGNMVQSHLKSIEAAGGTPDSVITSIRSLEGQMADLLGKGGTYHLPTSTDKNMAKALREVTDHLKDQLYNAAGANKNIAGVLTPEVRDQLLKIHPNNAKWASFVDNTVMKSKNVGDLRSIQSPFVNIQKIIDEADLNSMTFGGRLGNLTRGQGSLPGLVIGGATDLAKNPAARVVGNNLRDIGTGEIANQGAKGLGGTVANLGAVNLLASSMSPSSSNDTLEGSLGYQSVGPNMDTQSVNMNPMMQSSMNAPMSNSMGGQYQEMSGSSSPYSREALMYDIQRDPANAAKYIDYFKEIDSIFNPAQAAPKALTDSQQQRADLIHGLDLTEGAVRGGSINYGPIGSRIEGIKGMFNAADPETLNFKATIGALRGAIAKARAGTSMTPGEQAMLDKYTPSDTDSQQMVLSKLQALRNLYGYGQPTGGGQPTSIEDALMRQGAY